MWVYITHNVTFMLDINCKVIRSLILFVGFIDPSYNIRRPVLAKNKIFTNLISVKGMGNRYFHCRMHVYHVLT
jgi:hypothetical protein